jgi:hypothetical protein
MKEIRINIVNNLYLIIGEYEPIELDRSQITQMSLNGSLRKSLSNVSSYYNDFNCNNNINSSNITSNIPTFRGTYRSFNDLINQKYNTKLNNNIDSNNISSISNSSNVVLNLDFPLTNNSHKDSYNNNNDDLFDIIENSQEINDLANSLIESNGSNYNDKEDKDRDRDKKDDIIINDNNNIIDIKENGSTLSENNYNKEKKFDTYDSLFNNPIPNSNNFRYQFEEYDQNSNFPLEDYLNSNKKEKINTGIILENNINKINDNTYDYEFDRNTDDNNKVNNNNLITNENEVNKKKNTIDILTKEYMMKKMVSKNLKKNENRFFNLKKAMNSQQKNNY